MIVCISPGFLSKALKGGLNVGMAPTGCGLIVLVLVLVDVYHDKYRCYLSSLTVAIPE